jgi:hypothetical protein
MKRTSKVKVNFDDGTRVQVVVTTEGNHLMRDEAQQQHDDAVDGCVSAVKTLRYAGIAPYRCVHVTR